MEITMIPINFIRQKLLQIALNAASWGSVMHFRPLRWTLLGPVLVVLLLGHAFGYAMWKPPPGQPEQMRTNVTYDPNIADTFFESEEWICPRGLFTPVTCGDGTPVVILYDPCDSWLSLFQPERCQKLKEWTCPDGCKQCATCQDGSPVTRVTAKCYSNSRGVKHVVRFVT